MANYITNHSKNQLGETQEDEITPEAYGSISNDPELKHELTIPGKVQAQQALSDPQAQEQAQAQTNPMAGAPSILNRDVVDSVSRSLASKNGSTPTGPESLMDNPMMQDFQKREQDHIGFQRAQLQASTAANVAQALSQLSQGANTPNASANTDLYKNIGNQNQLLSKEVEGEETRRQNVIKAIEQQQGRKDALEGRNSLLKEGQEAKGDALTARNEQKSTEKQNAAYQTLVSQAEQVKATVKQAEADIYAAGKANRLGKLYGDPSKLSAPMVKLLVSDIAKIASGGVPSQHELEGLTPGTLESKFSDIISKLRNEPTPANAGEFVKQYMDYANALTKDARKVIHNKYGRLAESYKPLISPSQAQLFNNQYVNRFDNEDAEEAKEQKSPSDSGPKPGQIEDGHKYLGGNPSDPKNWEVVS